MNLAKEAEIVINILEQHGFEAYAVGGCVRDSIMGKTPKDWDVCTSARPEDVVDVLSQYTVIETGLKHGTVTVLINEEPIEVTTYRVDGEYENNRRPTEVRFVSSLKEDLSRRDFTMNALAYNPQTGIVDYFDGESHIKEKIIKSVGDPERRIKEDGLRLLRALRFSSRLGFSVDEDLSRSIIKHKGLLNNISFERIQTEFNGILMGPDSARVLSRYREVIEIFVPEIKAMFGFEQNNPYHHLDVWEHTLETVSVATDDLIVKLTMFFHDIGKPSTFTVGKNGMSHFYEHPKKSVELTRKILRRLKYSNQMVSDVLTLIKYHDIVLTEKNILRWMNRIGEERVSLLLHVMTADIKSQSPDYLDDRLNQLNILRKKYEEIIEENKCFKIEDLALDGGTLIKLGYPQGKEIGDILEFLLNAVMDGDVSNDKDSLIKFLGNSPHANS